MCCRLHVKEIILFPFILQPNRASYYLFTESSSIVGLGEFLFSEDFNCLALTTNTPVSTPSLYAEIYIEKEKRPFCEALKIQNEVLPHFLGESDI